MNFAFRFVIAFKALRELGAEQLGLYAIYTLGLKTGHYHRQLNSSLTRLNALNIQQDLYLKPNTCLPNLPDRKTMLDILGDQIGQLYEQADEIVNGKVRLFGGPPVELVLSLSGQLEEWTKYERKDNQFDGQDIKFIWEPGRFGWACTLAMAYHLSKDERYADTFWQYTEFFLTSNPPYLGPHWSSGQEVGIRLVALAFALQVFAQSKNVPAEKLDLVAKSISIHAERIPATLVYARSQNNNHLITEALGLYTASALLPNHPLASKWHKLGWRWLQNALITQTDPDGTYIQHSTNYHRLMLQAAMWAFVVHRHAFKNELIPEDIIDRLQATTRWLGKLVDPVSGHVPNLGHNDGAYILPITVCPYHDYRPVIHAASQAFLQAKLGPQGSWCDMGNWLCLSSDSDQGQDGINQFLEKQISQGILQSPPHMLEDSKSNSWISLRVVRFHSRPAHADQLHLDLWWRGLNIALDPGTYLYNANPPWDNSLTTAFVHNTITIDGKEFMLRAGRFLYLDWAQADVVGDSFKPGNINLSLLAEHNGYRGIGVRHKRFVVNSENGRWKVTDYLDGSPDMVHIARLHWLLPDWEYEIQAHSEPTENALYNILIRSQYGWVTLKLGLGDTSGKPRQINNHSFQLARAGEVMYGSGPVLPISGWASPTYGRKIPALSCSFEITQSLPIELNSEWILPNES